MSRLFINFSRELKLAFKDKLDFYISREVGERLIKDSIENFKIFLFDCRTYETLTEKEYQDLMNWVEEQEKNLSIKWKKYN
jgi:hypothetical protein